MAAVRPDPAADATTSLPGRVRDALRGRTLTLTGGFLGLCALGQFVALVYFVVTRGGTARPAGGEGNTAAVVESAAAPGSAAPAAPIPSRPSTREEIAALAPLQPTPTVAGTAPLSSSSPSAAAVETPAPFTPLAPAASAASSVATAMPPDPATVPAPAFVQPTPALTPLARGLTGGAGGVTGTVAELVEQAKVLRARGDSQSALARLREAQNLTGAVESGPVIAEMALTYEGMGFTDRANEQWQRLLALGESAGAPYYLAESRLRGGISTSAADVSPPGNAGGPDPLAGSGRDRNGFQQNALLRIVEAKVEDDPSDPEAERKLALRTVIKSRPGAAIDARKVRVEAQFYDLVNGQEIQPTDAETGFQWLSPPVDWAADASEILEATYRRAKGGEGITGTPAATSASALLPPPPPPSSPTPGGGRGVRRGAGGGRNGGASSRATPIPPTPTPTPTPEPAPTAAPHAYLGYVIRLYYNRQLQDVRAEPSQLLERFPPVLTLPAETTAP